MLFHKVYICICKTVRDDVPHVFLCIMHPMHTKAWSRLAESKLIAEVTEKISSLYYTSVMFFKVCAPYPDHLHLRGSKAHHLLEKSKTE